MCVSYSLILNQKGGSLSCMGFLLIHICKCSSNVSIVYIISGCVNSTSDTQ